MRTLAIDPGGTTGMALFNTRDNGTDFESWEIPGGLEGFAQWNFNAGLPLRGFDQIVMESFIINEGTYKKTAQYDALYIIGYVRALSHLHGPPVKMQSPPKRKGCTDAMLKALKWYDRSPGGHANDAARHLVVHLLKADKTVFRPLFIEAVGV